MAYEEERYCRQRVAILSLLIKRTKLLFSKLINIVVVPKLKISCSRIELTL